MLVVSYDITECKQSEAALQASEEKYRTLVSATSKMVWTADAQGNIIREVPGWESFTGQTFDEYQNFGWLSALHPDDVEPTRQIWQSAIEHRTTAIAEYRLQTRAGDYRRVVVRDEPLLAADGNLRGWVGTIADIEEMCRAEAAAQAALDRLRESETKYRSLFASMDEGYVLADVIFDGDDRPIDLFYIEANPTAVRMVGTELAGKTLRELDPNFESQWFETFGRVARTGIGERHEFYTAPLDAWYDFYVFKVGDPDDTQVAAVSQDVSDRKRTEEQLRHAAEIDAFRVKLSDALRSLSDPIEVQRMAMRVIGEHLQVDRVFYTDMMPDDVTTVIHDNYVRDGVPKFLGSVRTTDFGSATDRLRNGETVVITDANASEYTEAQKAAYAGNDMVAAIAVPLVKASRWVATLVTHERSPGTTGKSAHDPIRSR